MTRPTDVSPATLPVRGDEGGLALFVLGAGPPRGVKLVAGADLRVGRSPGAEIVVDDPSLSRLHAVFRLRGAGVEVEDLGSSNGTLVRGERLAAGVKVALAVGDSARLGDVMIVVQRAGTERAPAPVSAAPSDDLVARVAASAISVLVLGETGVGKEVMAERIHALSPRAAGPLVKLHCAALMASVLESELFGYEKGAFTGAVKDKPGLVESADGGTLFLDEIGEVAMEVQAKLLRVLEARETQRIGALRPKIVDVRFVAATNRDPEQQIRDGTLRADLYYRLAGFAITVPPLRTRSEQIPALAVELLARDSGGATLEDAAVTRLVAHDWPGNVRELRNVLARAQVIAGGPLIRRADVDEALRMEPRVAEPVPAGRPPRAETLPPDPERAKILAVLDECGGNQSIAADKLGMSRRALVYRLQAWGLTRPRRR